jgi:putative NADH-flavin reductase
MQQSIKIAVIGGSGKSGQYLVKQLLRQGFPIKILLRNPDNFQINHPLAEVIQGNVSDYETVFSLIQGCNAVISTLGLGIPASEPTIFSQATTHIIQAMQACSIKRYIVTTGLNVDTHFDKKSPETTAATNWMKTTYPVSTANKQLEYEILTESSIDWTMVRLPLIEQTDEKPEIKISLEDCPGNKISATSLAHFLTSQLADETFIKKAPFVANA